MSDKDTSEPPAWLPTIDSDVDPKPQQRTIIESGDYPMRVLAGAGTGKTFTMVRKIRYLIDVAGVSPDRVLALTFTNNAADSMQEKLHARLGTSGYDVEAYTYHSICNAILQDYAYQAGVDPEFDIVTDAGKYTIALEVLDEIDYRTVSPNVYGPDSYASGAADSLTSFISSMKRSGISAAEIDTYLGSAQRLYELSALPEKIEEIASEHLGGQSVGTVLEGLYPVRKALNQASREVGHSGIEASIDAYLEGLVGVSDSLIETFEAHEAGNRDLPEYAYKIPKYLFGGYSSGAPKGIPDDSPELTTYLDDFLEDARQARDLVGGYQAYERELATRNLLDFDDLVVKTVALLQSEAGAQITDRWDYVFCDEFQDTDRLQFELVQSLISDDNLFVVGDDDQAIYEWRGANVGNITEELDGTYGSDLTDEPLEQNFRSRQPILDLANEALEELDGRSNSKTLTRVEEPSYGGDSVVTIEEAEDEADRVEQLVTTVRNLLTGEAEELDQAYEPGDIGLLVRKNKHAEPLLEAFEELGIPYQLTGDLASESVGVNTVVAYLKALARPESDEVSWNRVLTMRYRLNETDLHHLNTREDTLIEALSEAPLEEFEEPDRVETARDHVDRLLELRKSASLKRLYRELKELTNIEWYLSDQERRDLSQLEDVIERFGDGAVQPPLNGAFIETLQHHEEAFSANGGTPTDQPELANDAINIMTIHKSKGLDFPVVIMPRLTADEWAPSSRTYDQLEAAVTDTPEAAFEQDFVAKDARETRRVLHVGLTRAEDILVLQGRADNEDATEVEPTREVISACLDNNVPWTPGAGTLPIWQTIQQSLPPESADWTDTLAASVVGDASGDIVYDGDSIDPETAVERILDLGDQLFDGSIDEPASSQLRVDTLSGPVEVTPAVDHSYTSLKSYHECPRKHYLDYVVNAYPDYSESDVGQTGGISQREIGILFHDTAEQAAKEGATEPNEWYEISERLASQRRSHEALPHVKEAIDSYFELDLSGYEVVDAERRFELDIDGHTIVGFIDAVYRTPDNELIIIDYKATERRRDLQDDQQLPIYLLASQELYDQPISRAGYAYVGEIGPEIDTRSFTEKELKEVKGDVLAAMDQIETFSFEEFSAGDHCQWCAHNDLPCAPENSGVVSE